MRSGRSGHGVWRMWQHVGPRCHRAAVWGREPPTREEGVRLKGADSKTGRVSSQTLLRHSTACWHGIDSVVGWCIPAAGTKDARLTHIWGRGSPARCESEETEVGKPRGVDASAGGSCHGSGRKGKKSWKAVDHENEKKLVTVMAEECLGV